MSTTRARGDQAGKLDATLPSADAEKGGVSALLYEQPDSDEFTCDGPC